MLSLLLVGSGCSACRFYVRTPFPTGDEVRRITVTRLDRGDGAPPLVIEDRATIAKVLALLSENNVNRSPSFGVIPIARYGLALERADGTALLCEVGGSWVRVKAEAGRADGFLRMDLPDALALRRLLESPSGG
jgi:hypothetical protein